MGARETPLRRATRALGAMRSYVQGKFGWFLSIHGSSIPRALPPALLCATLTFVLNYFFHDELFTHRKPNDFLQHPYAHQVYAVVCGFMMVFRNQIAYGRFWEARTMFATMQSKWLDAVQQAFIFDDMHKSAAGTPTPRTGDGDDDDSAEYRKRMLHLFSVLHAMACIRLNGMNTIMAGDVAQVDQVCSHEGSHQIYAIDEWKSSTGKD